MLPGHSEDQMDPKDLEMFRQLLNGMLDDILRKGEETLEDMTDTREVYADPADRATAESDRSFTLRLRDRERKLIKKIQEAIQRLEDGTYGLCEECGEEIGVPRLQARPVTTLCIACKSRQEEEESMRGD
jgi:DnaK suppressor protein